MLTALRGDTALAGLSLTAGTETVRVYDDAPEGAKYPHVLFGNAIERPWNALGGLVGGIGWNDVIDVHVMSRYQGKNEAMAIHERVVYLLTSQLYAVAGFGTVYFKSEGHKILNFKHSVDKIETRDVNGQFRVMVRQ